jgi:hypothetical protein
MSHSIFNGRENISVNPITILAETNQQLANAIATGPQDEFYEKLERANWYIERWTREPSLNISVTPSWNWRPGTYDRIRKATISALEINKKSCNIGKFFERTRNRSHYFLENFQSAFETCERIKKELKQGGYSANVDINEYQTKMIDFSSKIKDECEKVEEFGKGNITITPHIHIPENNIRATSLILEIKLIKQTMNILQDDTLIQEIPMEPIKILFNSNLRKIMSYSTAKTALNRSLRTCGIYESENISISNNRRPKHLFEHPYIGALGWRGEQVYGAVCFDKFSDDIRNSYFNFDFIGMILQILSWGTYYNISHANPYNQPVEMHFGMPKSFNKAYKSAYSITQSTCSNKIRRKYNVDYLHLSKEHLNTVNKQNDICSSIKCEWALECSLYEQNQRVISTFSNEIEEYRYKVESYLGALIEMCINTETLGTNDGVSILIDTLYNAHSFNSGRDDIFEKIEGENNLLEFIVNHILHENIFNYEIHRYRILINSLVILKEKHGLNYWGDDIDLKSVDKTPMNNEEIKSTMLQWATEGRM